ncbi:MAG: tetratricopeptide repeat protein [Thermoguttaceae bacterium]|jgi:tetratricopeptide (TPR) repeat protein
MAREPKQEPSFAGEDSSPAASVTAGPDGGQPRRPAWPGWAKDGAFAAALLLAVLLTYRPAWNGGFLWDDNAHITRSELRSWHGLYRIWFDVGATVQYYPLACSAFWVEHKLWGDATLGYHLVNIVLHALSALMVALIVRRLAIPGAYLAAAIFALHPVHVESVAWITELKNTLSGFFYLGALLLYLRFHQTRKASWYLGALGLFLLALLSKTATVMLPAVLPVIFWWQRGRLSWKRDLLPLTPFFLLSAAAGMVTVWVERQVVGAAGNEFNLSLVQRCLLAARAICFYLGKLCWPTDLLFVYPRWNVNRAAAWQYLYPAAALLLVAVLWRLRGRWRGPLAGLLFFAGTLFPVLGFLNLFFFRYSFVADHFQYLASLGMIVLFAAAATLLLKRAAGWRRTLGQTACLALLAVLAVLSWRQSRMYADAETLYRATLERNPACWLAHSNLGLILRDRGQVKEAIAHFRRALEIEPDFPETWYNLGAALAGCGQVDEAIAHYQKALEIQPDHVLAHNNLGAALAGCGRVGEAIAHYRKALEIQPDHALAHNNLGTALAGCGQVGEAIAHYQKALEIAPDFAEAHYNLGTALVGCGQVDEAIGHYRRALEIAPDYTVAHNNLGSALAGRGQVDEAIGHYRRALEIAPDYAGAHYNLGLALAGCGQVDEAIAHYQKALEIQPGYAEAHYNLGLALAGRGQVDEAVAHYRRALEIAPDYALAHHKLGNVLFGRGRIDEAIAHYQKALEIKPDYAETHNNLGLALAGRGQSDEAIASYRKALAIRPDYLEAHYNLGLALASRGERDEATEHYQKALDLASARNDKALADVIRAQIRRHQSVAPAASAP